MNLATFALDAVDKVTSPRDARDADENSQPPVRIGTRSLVHYDRCMKAVYGA